jgi:SAM-dependent methyltransferase
MREMAQAARAFHRARLASAAPAELEERASFTREDDACLVECGVCGLILRYPQPSRSVETYAEDRYPDARLPEMIASQKALYRKKVPILRRLLRNSRSSRVVEVGSFVGGFLELARSAGWRGVGVDPNPQLAESCESRGLAVFRGTLEEFVAHDRPGSADVIAIWNTFDQITDPQSTLAAAAALLRSQGVLAVRVPHGRYFRRLQVRRTLSDGPRRRLIEAMLAWNNLLSFPYARGYGIESLQRVVVPHGFELVRVQGDVLGLLTGRATAAFARAEERTVKHAQALSIAARSVRHPADMSAAPWLDFYFRRTP